MIKMNNKLLDSFNQIEKDHWWWEGRRRLVKNLLAGNYPKRILDIGCGTGETLTFLKNLYPKAKLYGIDISNRAVMYSKQRGHWRIQKASANTLPFKNNFFDAVLYLDVLEHIKDDAKAISEAKRVLKSKGVIIITAPALGFIWSGHDTGQGHQRRYTRRAIKSLARLNKLKVSFISYFNFFLSPPIILIRILSNLKPFRSVSNYDRSINYDIAFMSLPNKLLKRLFLFEIEALRFVKYPIGISVAAKLTK